MFTFNFHNVWLLLSFTYAVTFLAQSLGPIFYTTQCLIKLSKLLGIHGTIPLLKLIIVTAAVLYWFLERKNYNCTEIPMMVITHLHLSLRMSPRYLYNSYSFDNYKQSKLSKDPKLEQIECLYSLRAKLKKTASQPWPVVRERTRFRLIDAVNQKIGLLIADCGERDREIERILQRVLGMFGKGRSIGPRGVALPAGMPGAFSDIEREGGCSVLFSRHEIDSQA